MFLPSVPHVRACKTGGTSERLPFLYVMHPFSGTVAGNARKDTEKELGRSIVSEENYLSEQLSETGKKKLPGDN